MKILHFIEGRCSPDTANGIDKVVYYLSQAESSLGNEVVVLCESSKPVLPVPEVKVINVTRRRSCLRLASDAREVLEEIAPDIIHLHSAYIPTGISIARWARSHSIPYVVSPHGNYSIQLTQRRKFFKHLYKTFFELPCAKKAAFVHSMGESQGIRDFGYKGKTVDIPNGYAMQSYLPSSKTLPIPEQAKGKSIILYIGRMDFEQKGLDLLINGFASAKEERAFLLVVGPSWRNGLERAKKLAKTLNLSDRQISFENAAFGQNKADLLHAADFFIHASRWEGFPMAVIEAMAYRKVCIVTEAADPQQILANHQLGIICKPNSRSIAEGIRSAVVMDQERRRELGQKSRDLVQQNFNWLAVAERMQAAYAEALK